MRSVYARILLWGVGFLLFCFSAIAGWFYISFRPPGKEMFLGLIALQVQEASDAYTSGGVTRLSVFMERLDRLMPGEHYFVDSAGRDLITGTDRSALMAGHDSHWTSQHHYKGRLVTVNPTPDDKFRLITIHKLPVDFASALPYGLVALAGIAGLCWALSLNLASPLRSLARTVDRFGRGDLAVRVHSKRHDEIGDLARSFDQMAERIQTLLTAERRLLQDISHELRSPLARLSFAAELGKTAEDRNAAAARIRKEIDRLASLVGSLLEMTRLEGDPSSRHVEEVMLGPLLRDLVEDCRVEAEARGCRVVLDAAPLLVVRGDRELLRRAVENVLRNAIRYAPDGTAVEIGLAGAGDGAAITIRDYGPGVPEESLTRIFTPFFRVDPSRDNSTGGIGLGLAIAQRAINLHHGRLVARNAGPGLVVSIELPLAAGKVDFPA
jgi:signal transduction histidine kinase